MTAASIFVVVFFCRRSLQVSIHAYKIATPQIEGNTLNEYVRTMDNNLKQDFFFHRILVWNFHSTCVRCNLQVQIQ